MLAFIIPLKSAKVSSSWNLVCQLLERTLKSVCNQTVEQFQVIIVCHERPNISFNPPQLTYVQVDFPIPGSDYASKEKDKMLKMLAGLNCAKEMRASHVMFVDADDCVSKFLAEFVSKNIQANGWFINKGYDYQENIGRLRIRNKNLHLRTNTSHIVKLELLEPDMNMVPEAVKRGDCVLYHIDTAKILTSRGTPLACLPFRGVIYITDNGENMWWSQQNIFDSSKSLKQVLLSGLKNLYQAFITRSITGQIRDEFGLYDICVTS